MEKGVGHAPLYTLSIELFKFTTLASEGTVTDTDII
jgi:hypothetical protein